MGLRIAMVFIGAVLVLTACDGSIDGAEDSARGGEEGSSFRVRDEVSSRPTETPQGSTAQQGERVRDESVTSADSSNLGDSDEPPLGDEADGTVRGDEDSTENSTDPALNEEASCPADIICVDSFPFVHEGDTTLSEQSEFDSYDCDSGVDESGPEVIYQVQVTQAGFLSAAVYDGLGVDVDIQILNALDPSACLDRGHHHARTDVEPGIYYVVVDTYVDEQTTYGGAYRVDIGLTIPSIGPCQMQVGEMKRVGDGGDHLPMPATGPMVMEAHLVTQEEPAPFPSTSTEELQAHYALSQDSTGFVMYRDNSWAPLEGGSFYGAGIGSPSLFPVLHEHWYVNMYWTKESRPERGTRMILQLPGTDVAVVVAAGYETGPGNLANIGGTPEEPHFYLGTGHKSVLTLGIAEDQNLPFGPRICDDSVAPPSTDEPVTAGAAQGEIKYPVGQIHSPITPEIAEAWLNIVDVDLDLSDDVFMKVGASGSVSSNFLTCFAGSQVDEEMLTDAELSVMELFLGGDAAGTDPFSRKSKATKIGMSTVWSISGNPSPVDQEIAALSPRFALIAYGTNDMQLGTTYQSAIWGFGDNLVELTDQLIQQGIIPTLASIPQRFDFSDANQWVPAYNAVIRGVAQSRRVPFMDLNLALDPLPNKGISGDGIHTNVYKENGYYRACRFSESALQYGFNMRNRITLATLSRQVAVMVDGQEAPDTTSATLLGTGAPSDPYVIDSLPFTHMANTEASPWSLLDTYSGCAAYQDESGPEIYYSLVIDEPTAIRAMTFDRGGVDIDIHLLDQTMSESGCLMRDHRIIQTTLEPGTYTFVLDSYVSQGQVKSGEYLLAIHQCVAGDTGCD